MRNPWLDIPLADYEGHMALPYVAQAQLLSDLFTEALKEFSPQSVAVLGCAGGNGFDRISPQVTNRVVGIDLNPEYIQEARRRFQDRFSALELFAGDIQTDVFDFSPVDLVFASLLFEYVDVEALLARSVPCSSARARLVTVVQLPNAGIPEVTPTPFTSLRLLSSVMRLVSLNCWSAWLRCTATSRPVLASSSPPEAKCSRFRRFVSTSSSSAAPQAAL